MSKGRILVIAALFCVAVVAAFTASARDDAVWSISVLNLKGESLGTLTVELTDESAETCMSGNWKKARLIQSSFPSLAELFETKEYFPTYEADGEVFTMQLNAPRLCDAYLMLSGKFSARDGSGDYRSLGLDGGTPLGTFTAKKL